MTSSLINERLLRNRQRRTTERLMMQAAAILPRATQFLDAVESKRLNSLLRSELAYRRPLEAGHLLITRDRNELGRALHDYLARRGESLFFLFAAHWEDAGAVVATGGDIADAAFALLLFDGDGLYGCDSRRSEIFSADRTIDRGQETWELFFFELKDSD